MMILDDPLPISTIGCCNLAVLCRRKKHKDDDEAPMVVSVRRRSYFAYCFLSLWPYIELDTILLLPILILCQLICGMTLLELWSIIWLDASYFVELVDRVFVSRCRAQRRIRFNEGRTACVGRTATNKHLRKGAMSEQQQTLLLEYIYIIYILYVLRMYLLDTGSKLLSSKKCPLDLSFESECAISLQTSQKGIITCYLPASMACNDSRKHNGMLSFNVYLSGPSNWVYYPQIS
jgi:hypothetical protein